MKTLDTLRIVKQMRGERMKVLLKSKEILLRGALRKLVKARLET